MHAGFEIQCLILMQKKIEVDFLTVTTESKQR